MRMTGVSPGPNAVDRPGASARTRHLTDRLFTVHDDDSPMVRRFGEAPSRQRLDPLHARHQSELQGRDLVAIVVYEDRERTHESTRRSGSPRVDRDGGNTLQAWRGGVYQAPDIALPFLNRRAGCAQRTISRWSRLAPPDALW